MLIQLLLRQAYGQSYTYTLERDTAYMNPIEILLHNPDTTLQDCKAKCGSLQECAGFSIIDGRECYLKTRMAMSNFDPITDSYIKQIVTVSSNTNIPEASPVPVSVSSPEFANTSKEIKTTQIKVDTPVIITPAPSETTGNAKNLMEPTVSDNKTISDHTYTKSSNQSSDYIFSSPLIFVFSIIFVVFAMALIAYTLYKYRGNKKQKRQELEHSGRFKSTIFTASYAFKDGPGDGLNLSIQSCNAFAKSCISMEEKSF